MKQVKRLQSETVRPEIDGSEDEILSAYFAESLSANRDTFAELKSIREELRSVDNEIREFKFLVKFMMYLMLTMTMGFVVFSGLIPLLQQ